MSAYEPEGDVNIESAECLLLANNGLNDLECYAPDDTLAAIRWQWVIECCYLPPTRDYGLRSLRARLGRARQVAMFHSGPWRSPPSPNPKRPAPPPQGARDCGSDSQSTTSRSASAICSGDIFFAIPTRFFLAVSLPFAAATLYQKYA